MRQIRRKMRKNQIAMNPVLAGLTLIMALTMQNQASTVRIFDDSLSVNSVPVIGATASIGARLGTWNGTSFTAPPSSVAAGYFDNDLKELSATISASANATVGINQGNAFAIAIYDAASTAAYSSSLRQAVLRDPSWIMPTLDFSLTVNNFFLTANTTALVGTYDFNGGNQQIGLIPEPSAASLMLLGVAALFASRKRGVYNPVQRIPEKPSIRAQ
jgi:hypothetical protein